jgi:protein-tyrosine phosphatase
LAEALARDRIAELGLSIRATSAGVSAVDGAVASADAQAAAAETQLDLSKHRARLLTRAMLLESDLVLTMSDSHAQLARLLAPEVADRVHRLGDYADVVAAELPDPFGRGLPAYRDTLNALRGWVSRSLDRYVEGAKSHER